MARHRLTDKVRETVCAFIRAGGFTHVAAEAAGLPYAVFTRWLRRGRRSPEGSPCRRFYEAVTQAQAQARLAAETRALQKDPLAWLKSGPGRETTTLPGWTNPTRPLPRRDSGSARTEEVLATLVRLLEPYPQARAAVAQALIDDTKRDKGTDDEGAESDLSGDSIGGNRGGSAALGTPTTP